MPRIKKKLPVLALVVLAVLTAGLVYGAITSVQPTDSDAVAAAQREEMAKWHKEKASIVPIDERVLEVPAKNRLDVKRPTDRKLRVALYGDSLAYGMYASKESLSYRPLLEKRLAAGGPLDFRAFFFKGARIEDMIVTADPAPGVDLSIMELGLNDGFRETSPADFQANYRKYLAAIKKASPDGKILCLGLWSEDRDDYRPYESAIKLSCAEAGGQYANLNRIYFLGSTTGPAGRETWVGESDDNHPNDKGHRMIADFIMAHVPKLRG